MARQARDLKASHDALEDQASRLVPLVKELEIDENQAAEFQELTLPGVESTRSVSVGADGG